MTELVLGLDLGTHGVRAVAVDREGVIRAHSVAFYERIMQPGGVQEQSLEVVLAGVLQALREVVATTSADFNLAGMAVTHQRGTLVVLDRTDCPIGHAICDSDTRSWPQAHWLADQVGAQELYSLTGCPPLPFNGLTKILWWRQTFPEKVDTVSAWVSMQDWLVNLLTGERLSSPGAALRQGVIDIRQPERYAFLLLDQLEIDPSQFWQLRPFGEVLGFVSGKFSDACGLPAGLPVFPAPGDQPAAVLGSGALASGAAAANLGTSFLLSFPVAGFIPFAPGTLYTLEVLPDGRYALELGEGSGTNVLDWLRIDLLGLPSVESLNALATSSPPGANGLRVLPYWWGALNDHLCGVVAGLTSNHTRADLVRATLEALAFELRWVWDIMTAKTSLAPREVALFGGASHNPLLCQILATLFGRPVYRPATPEASALGAALSAAVGLGWYCDYTSAAAVVKREAVIEPAQALQDYYQEAYLAYLSDRQQIVNLTLHKHNYCEDDDAIGG